MTVDLIVFGAVLLFAVLGGFAGAAKQVAQVVSMAVAWVAARPVGSLLGPHLAKKLGSPELFGTVAATLLVFFAVMIGLRLVLTALLRLLLRGKDPKDRGLDRGLGFLLGGLKVAFLCYLLLSGLAFVEEHVKIAGQKLGISPASSMTFAFARRYNFFELTEFGAVKDVAALAQATSDPDKMAKLKTDPAYAALRKDPRFQKALEDPEVKKAAEAGDYRALLRSNSILSLIQDEAAVAKLQAALGASR